MNAQWAKKCAPPCGMWSFKKWMHISVWCFSCEERNQVRKKNTQTITDTENNLSGEREWEQTETSYKWLEFHCNCKCTTNFLRFKGYFHTCSSFRLGCISWWLCKFVAFCLWQWLLSHTVNFRLTTQCHYEPREKILLACWPDVSEAEATTKSRRSRRSFSVVVCWTTSGQFY